MKDEYAVGSLYEMAAGCDVCGGNWDHGGDPRDFLCDWRVY